MAASGTWRNVPSSPPGAAGFSVPVCPCRSPTNAARSGLPPPLWASDMVSIPLLGLRWGRCGGLYGPCNRIVLDPRVVSAPPSIVAAASTPSDSTGERQLDRHHPLGLGL